MRKIQGDIENLHDYDLYIPTRTIVLGTNYGGEDDEELGVNHYMITRFYKNLHILESMSSDPIRIILNTTGGNQNQGMGVYDAIREANSFVTIVVIGEASSMGSIIAQAGDERLIHKNATMMFHLGQSAAPEGNPQEVLRAAQFEVAYTNRVDEILYHNMLVKNPNLTRAKFNEMNWKSKSMFAEEAVALGLADRVIDPDAERDGGKKARG